MKDTKLRAEAIEGVKRIIGVASGKGGVGKSTVSGEYLNAIKPTLTVMQVNLAVSLAGKGLKVGLVDADLFGPSIPQMMNLQESIGTVKMIEGSKKFSPLMNYGVKCLSIGLMQRKGADPIVWRGLMVMRGIEQLLRQTEWGELDILVVDLPPGTGDTQLTLSQRFPMSGILMVSSPQKVALSDCERSVNMFKLVNVRVTKFII